MFSLLSRRTPGIHQEAHVPGGGIVRDLVFGANDGLVAAFAVISGVHGADPDAGAPGRPGSPATRA